MSIETAEERTFNNHRRIAETRYATGRKDVFLFVRTSHNRNFGNITTRVGRLVVDHDDVSESLGVAADRSPIDQLATPIEKYSARQLIDQHLDFIAEHIREENLPELKVWAERARP